MWVGFDIGTRNLSWCVKTNRETEAVENWCLCDIICGTYETLKSGKKISTGHPSTKKKPTIAELCILIVAHLGGEFTDLCKAGQIDGVIIETQLGRANTTAKVVSHMVQTFFVVYGIHCEFRRPYSSDLDKRLPYKERKGAAISAVESAGIGESAGTFFHSYQKKDDLADSYLLLRK